MHCSGSLEKEILVKLCRERGPDARIAPGEGDSLAAQIKVGDETSTKPFAKVGDCLKWFAQLKAAATKADPVSDLSISWAGAHRGYMFLAGSRSV